MQSTYFGPGVVLVLLQIVHVPKRRLGCSKSKNEDAALHLLSPMIHTNSLTAALVLWMKRTQWAAGQMLWDVPREAWIWPVHV